MAVALRIIFRVMIVTVLAWGIGSIAASQFTHADSKSDKVLITKSLSAQEKLKRLHEQKQKSISYDDGKKSIFVTGSTKEEAADAADAFFPSAPSSIAINEDSDAHNCANSLIPVDSLDGLENESKSVDSGGK